MRIELRAETDINAVRRKEEGRGRIGISKYIGSECEA